ncbi:MAG: YdeI/OmpD-associated family protein [Niastella sp.]|nr:YdeI/OmpD-associated family protein [Niastella sp.]
MPIKDVESFYPTNQRAWRAWLKAHHDKKESVWLVMYKKEANKPTIDWSGAVDEALCFGWVDSIRKSIDEERFMNFFTRRKPKGTWSKINKDKVKRLMEEGLMAPAGLAAIELAKKNGSWTMLDEVDKLTIPKDLSAAFKAHPGSAAYFKGLSKSVRKAMLQWILFAKRPETRQKRITEIVTLAAQQKKPKQF